jgi:hypothetical protein
VDLFGRELIAVDGTRIKAVNNKDRNFTRASLTEFIKLADARLDDYLQRLDQSDATESQTGGSRVKNLAKKIARSVNGARDASRCWRIWIKPEPRCISDAWPGQRSRRIQPDRARLISGESSISSGSLSRWPP